MIFNEKGIPNCLGYAFFKLGVLPTEGNVALEPLSEYPVEVVTENPEAVGVLQRFGRGREERLIHLVVIEKEDSLFVSHRPGRGDPVATYVPKNLALQPYDIPPCKIVYLRVKH